LTFPSTLSNEIDGSPIDNTTRKVVVLIHGWNRSGASNAYNEGEWALLNSTLKTKLAGTGWKLVVYHWETDANTGFIDWQPPNIDIAYGNAVEAAGNANVHGSNLADLLNTMSPNVRMVHFVAHSAGSWAARKAMKDLLANNPYVIVQMTLLDPFVPDANLGVNSGLSTTLMNSTTGITGAARIYRLENYYAVDSLTLSTQERFSWRAQDINQQVDHDFEGTPARATWYHSHSGPIGFYADTAYAATPGNAVPAGLVTLSPNFTTIGWYRSLSYEWFLLPRINTHPVSQTASSGYTATISVTATDSRPLSYQWYRNGTAISGATSAALVLVVTSLNMGDYVVRVNNSNGAVYSDKASIAISAPSTPVISTLSPASLCGQVLPQKQTLRVLGSGFDRGSTLTFNDGVNAPYSGRVPTYISNSELDYDIAVGTNAANWTVQVFNDAVTHSIAYPFSVTKTPAMGTLNVVANPVSGGSVSSSGLYPMASEQRITATPHSGWSFAGWQDGSMSTSRLVTITSSFVNYTANFNQNQTSKAMIALGAYPAGAGTVQGTGVFDVNSIQNISATPALGWVFVNWSDGNPNPGRSVRVLAGGVNVTANFGSDPAIMGNITGQARPVDGGYVSGCGTFPISSDHTVTAEPYEGWVFSSWTDGQVEPSRVVRVVNGSTLVTANFIQPTQNWETVVLNVSPVGAGAVDGAGTYPVGTITQIQAFNCAGYTFTGWSDGCSSRTRTITNTTGGLTLTATYTPNSVLYTAMQFVRLAGNMTTGSNDGVGTNASFNGPAGIAVDSSGNVFVADSWNHTIRKITTNGSVSTYAGLAGTSGSTDGAISSARFKSPYGLAIDKTNNLYVADLGNHTIRKITPTGVVSTLAGTAGSLGTTDGQGSIARFKYPKGLTVDATGTVYVADTDNHTIRRISTYGLVNTVAGTAGSAGNANGLTTTAQFNSPRGIAVDSGGNLYVADTGNHTIRKVDNTGNVTTLAGAPGVSGNMDLTGNAARFSSPYAIAMDSDGTLAVSESCDIRKVTLAGRVTTIAGQAGQGNPAGRDGVGSMARFSQPIGPAIDSAGNYYVADWSRNLIRKGISCTPTSTTTRVTVLSNPANGGETDGTATCLIGTTIQLVAYPASGWMFIGWSDTNTLNPRSIVVPELGATYTAYFAQQPAGMHFVTWAGAAGVQGTSNGGKSDARFWYPSGVAFDPTGVVYIVDQGNNVIRRVAQDGTVSTFAGTMGQQGSANGLGITAQFRGPTGIALDISNNVYVADTGNHTIRKITAQGLVSTLAGQVGLSGFMNGTASAALFNTPVGVAVDALGNVLVADLQNAVIRRISPTGTVSTVAGQPGVSGYIDGVGTNALFSFPQGLTVDPAGNIIVADQGNRVIRKISPVSTVTTVAGGGGIGGWCIDGGFQGATFDSPMDVTADLFGNIYVVDGETVRKIDVSGVVSTLAGQYDTYGSVDGVGTEVQFKSPRAIAVDRDGNLYVADRANQTIRKGLSDAPILQLTNIVTQVLPPFGGTVFGAGTYPVGATVQLQAMTNAGWSFSGWADGGMTKARQETVPSTGAVFTALFVQDEPETVQLVVQADPMVGGTVDPSGGVFVRGWQQQLTAAPATYFHFASWSGQTNGCTAASNTITVTLDSQRVVTAVFDADKATNNVPKWWLAQYGLTNFDVDAMADKDHDGFFTWQEWVAGTCPTNPASFFCFAGADSSSPTGMVLRWPSISNRYYTLTRSTNLVTGTNGFITIPGAQDMPATPTENCYTGTVQGVGPVFYRINVHE
jgi:uncharacterized repeat protein (TIGR02543 family)